MIVGVAGFTTTVTGSEIPEVKFAVAAEVAVRLAVPAPTTLAIFPETVITLVSLLVKEIAPPEVVLADKGKVLPAE